MSESSNENTLEITGEVGEKNVSMSNEDCVKIWLRLHETRNSPVIITMMQPDQGEKDIQSIEEILYKNLTQRLAIESNVVGFYVDNEAEESFSDNYIDKFIYSRIIDGGEDGFFENGKLYDDYCKFCREIGVGPLSTKLFTLSFMDRFPQFKPVRRGRKCGYVKRGGDNE
ncbi:hypothetical protein [uncultured Desulfuromusa sp.]|uniref:hypothetical protein n=1 Tax=uncultured Desulfuromusa sp. TaxID=219183 RepID=UPI002AA6C6D4|nr:hypothetical protein [uncultured Desulfuromusa sp.]